MAGNVVERSLSTIDQRIAELERELDDDDSEEEEAAAAKPQQTPSASATHGGGSWKSMLKARAKAEGIVLPVGLVAKLRGEDGAAPKEAQPPGPLSIVHILSSIGYGRKY